MAQTVYSNVINVKISGQEMLLEFGAIFPEAPPVPGAPLAFDPEVRVVMSLAGLKPYIEALQNALKALEHVQTTASPVSSGQAVSK